MFRAHRPVLAVTVLFAACAAAADAPPVPLMKGDRIVFLGDSITEQGAKEKGYVTLIQQALRRRLQQPDPGGKTPILVVDGAPDTSGKKNGDLWYLQAALDSTLLYRMERCTVEDLDKKDLDSYPAVFLVNVPEIKNDDTIKKLADYAAKGGGVACFLGEAIHPDFYNDKLFKGCENAAHEHLFPVLLQAEPSKPMSDREIEDRLVNDKQPKILFPDEDHPIIRGYSREEDKAPLVKWQKTLRYLTINRYWPCQPRAKWDPEPYQAQEAAVVPNRNSIDQYKHASQDYMNRLRDQVAGLAKDDKKFEPYISRVEFGRDRVIEALSSAYLYNLIQTFDDLLHDAGDKDDPNRPNMAELWAHPKMKDLKKELSDFIHTLSYGDPLVVTRPYGKGRAAVFLTTAGTSPRGAPPVSWNDWAGGPVAGSYPIFIKHLTDYLASDLKIEVIGAGVSGNKVPDIQARLDRDVLSKKPTIVVIYIGINDVWHGEKDPAKGTSKENYEAGLRDVIKRCQDAGARVVLCTPSVIGEKNDGSNTNDPKLDEYSDISRAVAKDMKIPMCDLRTAFQAYEKDHNADNKESGVLTGDRVHLNAAGNKFVADTILKMFGD